MSEQSSDPTPFEALEHGQLELTGRVVQASNATFYGEISCAGESFGCVYKPIRGERPLWDFPDGTLADREVAAYLISQATGWGVVPPTILRDGPFGRGMVQLWIDVAEENPVDIVPVGDIPDGWKHVLDAYDMEDRPVSLIHEDTERLRRMAIFDIVVNNADRKGGHVLPEPGGHVYGCDHGVCLHAERKLRTVLWGWAGEPLTASEVDTLTRLCEELDGEFAATLRRHLTTVEHTALTRRIDRLLAIGRLPYPRQDGPSIPWPAF